MVRRAARIVTLQLRPAGAGFRRGAGFQPVAVRRASLPAEKTVFRNGELRDAAGTKARSQAVTTSTLSAESISHSAVRRSSEALTDMDSRFRFIAAPPAS